MVTGRHFMLLGLVAFVLLGVISIAPAAERQLANTIVYIQCSHEEPGGKNVTVTGSGVVVSADGLVLTARHVVRPENVTSPVSCRGSVGIADSGSTKLMIVQPIPALNVDVALLRFPSASGLEFVSHCSLENWMVYREILVAGFPNATGTGVPSFRAGVLSTVTNDSAGVLETDGPTVTGMSGGPVFSQSLGLLVGIVIGAEFDAIGMVKYYGILPVGHYASELGLPQADGPCYRRTRGVDLSRSAWRAGDGAVKLGVRDDEGFCFIDKVWGQFNDDADSVGVKVIDGEYVLDGVNKSGGQHGASARCVWYH
jgi:Trypsin-like peptidase domain